VRGAERQKAERQKAEGRRQKAEVMYGGREYRAQMIGEVGRGSMAINSFRDLHVWQKSIAFVEDIYRLTSNFPKEEIYALTSQMRRCAVSIPSNIAEGYGRNSTPDYIRYLRVAAGSLYELQTQMEIAVNLGYAKSEVVDVLKEKAEEIARMLGGLINKLEKGR
jgi:four helix bundle protein